ncbi:MAG: type II toxin-antitoxin system VapC family toxin [Desulfovibrio sp.]|nr:type II toxin-antitoxin system VapC family toxin [Desulfovibrio sp.]
MKILLDTNALLWALLENPRILPVREILLDRYNYAYISSISIWEIAIKSKIKKISIDAVRVYNVALESGFKELPIIGKYINEYMDFRLHHKDPFDHIIVSQAMQESLTLITGDKLLQKYYDNIILI